MLIGLVALLPGPSALGAQTVDLSRAQLPALELVEVLRIGTADGPDDAFQRVSGARVDSQGHLYVLDSGIPALRVFDSNGRFLRQISRRGDGPGELRAPVSWGLTSDHVWIADQALGRVSTFSLEGQLISDRRMDPTAVGRAGAGAGLAPLKAVPEGGFLAVTPLGPDFATSERGRRPSFEQHLVRVDATLGVADTLRSYRMESPAVSLGGGGFLAFSTLFDGPIVVHESITRSIFIERRAAPPGRGTADFQVARSSGGSARTTTYRYQPLPLGQTVRDSIVNAMVERGQQVGRSRAQTIELLQWIGLPAHQPPIRAAHLARNGELWLEREEFAERTRWLVLNGELAPVSLVSAPRGRRPRLTEVVEGGVWAVEEDELGVQSVVLYRLVRQ